MKLNEDILNELRTLSTVVADVPFLNVYVVDAYYFDGIEAEHKARIAADSLGAHQKFTVPDGYFENLTTDILQKIKAAENEIFSEINEISPIIAGIGNKNIFTAPTHYFEDVTFIDVEKPAVKLVKMNSARSIFKYAAAAVITGLLGLGILNIANKTDVKLSENVSAQTAATIKTADHIIKTGSFDKELESISDEDIEKYLQQSGQDVNAALVAASTDDETTLPEAADYLLDENALDNYLKKKNLN